MFITFFCDQDNLSNVRLVSDDNIHQPKKEDLKRIVLNSLMQASTISRRITDSQPLGMQLKDNEIDTTTTVRASRRMTTMTATNGPAKPNWTHTAI
jgi:hypothetical protein